MGPGRNQKLLFLMLLVQAGVWGVRTLVEPAPNLVPMKCLYPCPFFDSFNLWNCGPHRTLCPEPSCPLALPTEEKTSHRCSFSVHGVGRELAVWFASLLHPWLCSTGPSSTAVRSLCYGMTKTCYYGTRGLLSPTTNLLGVDVKPWWKLPGETGIKQCEQMAILMLEMPLSAMV